MILTPSKRINFSKHTLRLAASLCIPLGMACGCGHPVQETVAHKIADALPNALGRAAHYEVQVDGDPFALSRGRAKAVHLQAQSLQLSPALTLDTLNADASDVSYDTQTRQLSHIGRTEFTATLGQTNLDTYLAHTKPLLPGLAVTLQPNAVEARVPVTVLGLQTTAALSGTLAPNAGDPSKLDFVTRGAQVGPVPIPAGLAGLAVDRLNPVVDLSGLRAPLTITHAAVSNRQVVLVGIADMNGLIRP